MSNFNMRRGRGGRGRGSRQFHDGNNSWNPRSILSVISKLESMESFDVALFLMDSKLGALPYLQKCDQLTVNQIGALLHHIIRAIENDTSPAALQRLLKELITSQFITKKIVSLLVQDPDWINLNSAMSSTDFDNFLLNVFKLIEFLFLRLESLAYDDLFLFTLSLEPIVAKNKTTNACDLVFRRIIDIRNCITQKRNKRANPVVDDVDVPDPLPPNNFKDIPILPTSQELKEEQSLDVFLRANKVKGRYTSVNDYLDVQYRLMREDFLSPLRDGVQEYMAEIQTKNFKHDHRLASVRMYLNTRVLYSIPANLGVAHVVQFNSDHFKHVNWDHTSRLRFGSLVILSLDNFKTIYFGVVLDRNFKDIQNGIITVQFTNPFPSFDQNYVMLESICYFEAYRHILSRLKMFDEENFPLSRYLIHCEIDVHSPAYLSQLSDAKLDLSFLAKPDIQRDSPRLKVEYNGEFTLWPDTTDLVLDESQYNALKMGLTKELAIIQGPPGTGKTYVGLKIVQALLGSTQSRIEDFGPIFLVCYTNHALDQFIEGVAEMISDGIVRVGGQSKSEKLQKFMINKLRSTVPRDYHVSGRLREIREETAEISEAICKYRAIQTTFKTNIHTIISLEEVIRKEHLDALKGIPGISSKDVIRMWLLGQVEQEEDYTKFDEVNEELCEEEAEEMLTEIINEDLRAFYEERQSIVLEDRVDMSDEINAWERNLRVVGDDFDESNVTTGLRLFERTFKEVSRNLCEIDMIDNNRSGWHSAKSKKMTKDYVRRQLLHLENRMTPEEVDRIANIWYLNIDQRWRLYRYWLWLYSQNLEGKCHQMENSYNTLMEESGQLRHMDDMAILAKAKIIGMTTTGAARYGRILNEIKPKILLVEEAAEVLESHIVSSLSSGSQQVILIGDHKQLKPTPAVFRLAKQFQLDISLFERLISNKFPHQTLALQHRMRPEISEIMQFIYPDLEDHEVVKTYPSVRGVGQNITFVNHNEPETFEEEGKSCFNQFEAEYCVALCRHFLLNDYKPCQITILALYAGQLQLIQSMMPKHVFDGVRITSVDNYQGEENDIIILSLVRSNDEERIGFTGIENRICVSLSRAKMGLFALGNFDLLSTKSDLWFKVVKHIQRNERLLSGVQLKCEIHSDPVSIARTAPDFAIIAPEGGCDKLCGQRLSCGHQCSKSCHVIDQEHEDYKCMKACAKTCENGHPCKRHCSDECSLCMEGIETILPSCGHKQTVPCHQRASNFSCKAPCEKLLPCGHPCQLKCGQICSTACLQPVTKELPLCGHIAEIPCSIDPYASVCNEPCGGVPECGHRCSGTCGKCFGGRLHIPCKRECKRALVCGHICNSGCPTACPPCKQACMDACCHNVCRKTCSEMCVPCREPCYWSCQHSRCTKFCNEMCNKMPCNRPCRKRYPCYTCNQWVQCVGLCDEPCPMECRNCNREQLQEIFFGNEDFEGSLYITLWTCNHTFEVNGLDEWMNTDSGSIQPKTCPKCNTPINRRSAWRYGNTVKRLQQDINKVKEKMVSQRRGQPENNLPSYGAFKPFSGSSEEDLILLRIFEIQPFNFKIRTADDTVRYDNFKAFLKSVNKMIEDKSQLSFKTSKVEAYRTYFHSMKEFILHLNPFLCCYSPYEVKQLNEELDRLRQMHRLITLVQLVGVDSQLGRECLQTGITPLMRTIGYSHDVKQNFEKIYQLLSQKCNMPFAGHSEQERTEIIAAMQFRQGHWYKCPNNHVYTIGDCGNPNQSSQCPECRAPIGGLGLLASGNSLLHMNESNRPLEL